MTLTPSSVFMPTLPGRYYTNSVLFELERRASSRSSGCTPAGHKTCHSRHVRQMHDWRRERHCGARQVTTI
jgi:hypothetical protein